MLSLRQLGMVSKLEGRALKAGGVPIEKWQAELWCLAHVGEDWYKLPLMLMSKGCNMDYSTWTEIAPDSVYEVDDTGCYVELAEWWTDYELWTRG